MQPMRTKLIVIYNKLRNHFGFLNWWPGDSPFEVMMGAILTQNTAWVNVEKAINNLKREGILTFDKLKKIDEKSLAPLIRSSGYFNQKAKKIKNFIRFMNEEFAGSISKMKSQRLDPMRKKLLSVNGIGYETADSILLYSLDKKIFVVDAYTKRIFSRIGIIKEDCDYSEVQEFFMKNLPKKLKLFNDYHAQIVILGKEICRKKPKCGVCPIHKECNFSRSKRATP